MHDLTLIIPTRDRAPVLAALLSYLETEKADCQLLVLDSSRSDVLATNRARIASSSLDIQLLDLIHLRYLLQQVPDSALEYLTEQQMAGIAFADHSPRGKVELPLCSHTSPRTPLSGPLKIQGRERSYFLSHDFYVPRNMASPSLNSVIRLLAAIDNYRPPWEMEPDASAAR